MAQVELIESSSSMPKSFGELQCEGALYLPVSCSGSTGGGCWAVGLQYDVASRWQLESQLKAQRICSVFGEKKRKQERKKNMDLSRRLRHEARTLQHERNTRPTLT